MLVDVSQRSTYLNSTKIELLNKLLLIDCTQYHCSMITQGGEMFF